jgi:hypothetical protein
MYLNDSGFTLVAAATGNATSERWVCNLEGVVLPTMCSTSVLYSPDAPVSGLNAASEDGGKPTKQS